MSELIFPGNGNGRGHSDALTPKQDMLKNGPGVRNEDGLSAVEILGRCSKCNAVGTLEYPKNMIPPKDIDNILAYKAIPGVRCLQCNEKCEFLPVQVKKYPQVPFLRTAQDQAKKGPTGIWKPGDKEGV